MIKVIALDLEGTLISNCMSQIVRPGLYSFLEHCNSKFERVVLFTTVTETVAKNITELLVEEGTAPAWFAEIEYVHWEGATKDLSFIPNVKVSEAILVDDHVEYCHVGQESQWISIKQFASPYSSDDKELQNIIELYL